MHRAFHTFIDSLLNPTNRVRAQCLLLLTLLTVTLLYLQAHPDSVLRASTPWDTTAGTLEFCVLAALCWVVVGARSPAAALALAGSIILLNEGMGYDSQDRASGLADAGMNLIGAAFVVLLLSALRASHLKRTAQARPGPDTRPGPYLPS
jgi:hypothetical protein